LAPIFCEQYDREALPQEIWQFTGVEVALCFHAIDTRVAKKRKNHSEAGSEIEKTEGEGGEPQLKALHVEIDANSADASWKKIENLYLSRASIFPLGFKLWLVPDIKTLTNTKARAKVASLHETQKQFMYTETCITWKITIIDLVDKTLKADLCTIVMNIPDLAKLDKKLFLAVHWMFFKNCFIICFNLNKSYYAHEVVVGLMVFLQGLWNGILDVHKCDIFFMTTAVEQAQDAWWDVLSMRNAL